MLRILCLVMVMMIASPFALHASDQDLPAFLEVVSYGKVVELPQLRVPGKRTVLFFASRATPSTLFMEPFLKRLASEVPGFAVRWIDIDRPGEPSPDFGSPIAKRNRITRDLFPFAKIYTPRGRLEAQGGEALAWIQGYVRGLPPPRVGEGPFPPKDIQGKVGEVTRGNNVNLDHYLSRTKRTIIMFHSPFCPPCKALRPQLRNYVEEVDGYILREVNVNRPGFWGIDYGSPVARAYRVNALPLVLVFEKGATKEQPLVYGQQAIRFLMEESRRAAAQAAEEAAKASALPEVAPSQK
jgi:thiol-disulfide isomerase/thioredoxin